MITTLRKGIGEKFVGTSNVELAMKHNLTPLGTMQFLVTDGEGTRLGQFTVDLRALGVDGIGG